MFVELKRGASLDEVTTTLNTVADTIYRTWKHRKLDESLATEVIAGMLRDIVYNYDEAATYAVKRISKGREVYFRVPVETR